MNIYNKVKLEILNVIHKNLKDIDDKTLSLITCEQPKNLDFGDLSSNVLMILKNKIKHNSDNIENLIISDLKSSILFDNVNYVKPGFINFILKKKVWYEVFTEIVKDKNFGFSNLGLNRKVNLEFISANPTGPLHVGHLRGAVLGDVLSRLMIKSGFKVTKEYYVNDLGSQIENLYETVKLHIDNKINNVKKELSENMYFGDYLKDIAYEIIEEEHQLNDHQAIKKTIIIKILSLIKRDLKDLGISFDNYISEKELHKEGMLNDILEEFKKKKLVYEGFLDKPKGIESKNWKPKKQLLFRSSLYGDSNDRAIKKNNGDWTYFASDIAYHHKKVLRGFDEVINIWGADHAGYTKRVKASLLALGHKDVKFDVVLCQIVNLLENNKVVKMSKRSGNFILINDILKKIDKDVVRFFMLIRKNDAHLDFDLKKCLEETKDNPIFYIQYAIARVNSVNNFIKEKKIIMKLINSNYYLYAQKL